MEIMETSSSDTGSGSYNNGHNGVTNSSDGDDVNSNHITQCSNKYPADIYLIKFNNRNNRKRCEICSKLTIKTSEQRNVNDVVLVHISHLFLVFLLYSTEKINICWVLTFSPCKF